MNFLIENWFLIVAALVSGGMLLYPMLVAGSQSGGVSPAQAVQLINREKAVVIEVCEPAEYAAGHVGGAKNIPLAQLAQQLPAAVKNKDLPVIFTCQSGSRSGSAARIAKGLGYAKAQSLGGGLAGWRAASLPVEKG